MALRQVRGIVFCPAVLRDHAPERRFIPIHTQETPAALNLRRIMEWFRVVDAARETALARVA